MTETPLDRAWMAAEADDAARPRFWDLFASSELFLAIDPETLTGDGPPKPLLFPVEGVETGLIFDTELRLAEFLGEAAHLTLSGRAAIGMFAGTGAQLGLNLGEAPSATVLPAGALDWAAAALRQPVEKAEAEAAALGPPAGATPDLLGALDAKLNGLGPAVAEAWLTAAGGRLLLCVALRAPGAETAVVSALAETARFAGGDEAAYDIAVLARDDARLATARRVGLGFEPEDPDKVAARAAPGMDKSKPPVLR